MPESLFSVAGAALDAAGVRWCLLRAPAAGGQEYDLLVDPEAVRPAAAALTRVGLVPLPSLGRGSHRFFLGYDPSSHAWLELDIVTELAYGPGYCLPIAGAGACLDRRQAAGGTRRLAPEDEFWTLLLHRLLDKGGVDEPSAGRLRELAAAPVAGSPLATPVAALLPPRWTVATVAALASSEDIGQLEALARAMLHRGVRRAPTATAARAARAVLGRALEKPAQLRSRRGVTVALLGPDGSGKSATARAVCAGFYLPARVVYLGLWADETGGRLRWAMRVALRPLRARWTYVRGRLHCLRGRLVVFDRYPYDALVPASREPNAWKRRYLELVGRSCPRPDRVLVLDVPGELAFRRKGESDPASLEIERAGYLGLVDRIGAEAVAAERPAEQVCADVTARIWSAYATRLGGCHA